MGGSRGRRLARVVAMMAVLALMTVPSAAAQEEIEPEPAGGGADFIINDDLLVNGVQGGTCTSDNNTCADTETFTNPSSTVNAELKLKSGVPGIWWNDTTNANADWTVQSGSGPLDFVNHAGEDVVSFDQSAEHNSLVVNSAGVNLRNINFDGGFGLIDGAGGGDFLITSPAPASVVRVEPDAASSALIVNENGILVPQVGFQGTANFTMDENPSGQLTIDRSDSPIVTIDPLAPTNSVFMNINGVGINTNTPDHPLNVEGAVPNAVVNATNTLGSDVLRTVFSISNFGPPSFTLIDRSPNAADWFFRASQSNSFAIASNASPPGLTAMILDIFGNMSLGGSLFQASSASIKHDVAAVDAASVLDAVRSLDISTWSYDAEPGVTHMGPMSEDFYEAFELGHTTSAIGAVDADGVALAAIKALADENAELETELANLTEQNAALELDVADLAEDNDDLEARINALEALVIRN